jgi:hypothetical protein
MCDKELLVGHLYDELHDANRKAFEQHLAVCADCRDELQALRGTRTQLQSWAPAEPDLGFQIVRTPRLAEVPRFRIFPAWALAAAAVLVVAIASAIANLHVTVGRDGIVVRTGWARELPQSAVVQAGAVSAGDLAAIQARVRDLETELANRRDVVAVSTDKATAAPLDDAAVLRRVRQLMTDSESRVTQNVNAKLVAGFRDLQAAHTSDLVRLQQTINQNQGALNDEVYRQREEMNRFYRLVGSQR